MLLNSQPFFFFLFLFGMFRLCGTSIGDNSSFPIGFISITCIYSEDSGSSWGI